MSRNACLGGRRAYAVRRAGASERVEVLTLSNELVITSFMNEGIYSYRLIKRLVIFRLII